MSPLAGQRVLVTRPRADAEELCSLLVAAGADPISIPVVRLRPLRTETELESWRARIRAGDFDLLVFTSANAVRQLAVGPADGGAVKLYAIGP
ncbi:MAG: uroporphyrinogen-III synthase, partial [Candidatus Dormiibacterota bacterium]